MWNGVAPSKPERVNGRLSRTTGSDRRESTTNLRPHGIVITHVVMLTTPRQLRSLPRRRRLNQPTQAYMGHALRPLSWKTTCARSTRSPVCPMCMCRAMQKMLSSLPTTLFAPAPATLRGGWMWNGVAREKETLEGVHFSRIQPGRQFPHAYGARTALLPVRINGRYSTTGSGRRMHHLAKESSFLGSDSALTGSDGLR